MSLQKIGKRREKEWLARKWEGVSDDPAVRKRILVFVGLLLGLACMGIILYVAGAPLLGLYCAFPLFWALTIFRLRHYVFIVAVVVSILCGVAAIHLLHPPEFFSGVLCFVLGFIAPCLVLAAVFLLITIFPSGLLACYVGVWLGALVFEFTGNMLVAVVVGIIVGLIAFGLAVFLIRIFLRFFLDLTLAFVAGNLAIAFLAVVMGVSLLGDVPQSLMDTFKAAPSIHSVEQARDLLMCFVRLMEKMSPTELSKAFTWQIMILVGSVVYGIYKMKVRGVEGILEDL